jgi:hypothetical protein
MKVDKGEIRIKVSKIKGFALTAITTGLLAVCFWAMFKVLELPNEFNKTFLVVGISTLIIAFGLGCISSLNKLVDSNQGLILNDTGIHINIGPNRGQFVPWDQIKGLKIHNQIQGGTFLLIFVKNPDHFLIKSSWLSRFFLKMNNVSHKTPLSLTSNWLDCSLEELFTTIEDKIKNDRLHD